MTIDEFFGELSRRKDLKWERVGGVEIRCHSETYIGAYLNTICCPITALNYAKWPILRWKNAARELEISSKDARKLANAADSRHASLRKRMLAACRLDADHRWVLR